MDEEQQGNYLDHHADNGDTSFWQDEAWDAEVVRDNGAGRGGRGAHETSHPGAFTAIVRPESANIQARTTTSPLARPRDNFRVSWRTWSTSCSRAMRKQRWCWAPQRQLRVPARLVGMGCCYGSGTHAEPRHAPWPQCPLGVAAPARDANHPRRYRRCFLA